MRGSAGGARSGAPDAPRAAALGWLAPFEGRTPAEIGRLFSGEPAALAGEERALLAELQGRTLDHPAMPEEVRLEGPRWAAEPLRRRFGPAFARERTACLRPAPLDLRVNPLKVPRGAVLRALRDLDLAAEPTPLAPHGIRLRGSRPARRRRCGAARRGTKARGASSPGGRRAREARRRRPRRDRRQGAGARGRRGEPGAASSPATCPRGG